MKKLLLVAILSLGIFGGANAQEILGITIFEELKNQNTNRFWVGGSVAVGYSSVKHGDSGVNFKVLPEVGYVYSDKVSFGLNIGYGQTKMELGTDLADARKSNYEEFIVAPFVRYTFFDAHLIGLFVDGTVGYSYGKDKDADVKSDNFEVGLKPGIVLNASNRLKFHTKIGFLGYQHSKAGEIKGDSFGLELDLSRVEFGASVFF